MQGGLGDGTTRTPSGRPPSRPSRLFSEGTGFLLVVDRTDELDGAWNAGSAASTTTRVITATVNWWSTKLSSCISDDVADLPTLRSRTENAERIGIGLGVASLISASSPT